MSDIKNAATGDVLHITMDSPDGELEADVEAVEDYDDDHESLTVDMNGTTVRIHPHIFDEPHDGIADVRHTSGDKIAEVTEVA